MDADFSNDPLLRNDILNKCEGTISEELNLDVLSNNIFPHNAIASCGKHFQCEARFLNELEFVTSGVYSKQCEKYVLDEATSFVTWGYDDPNYFVKKDSVGNSMVRILNINDLSIHNRHVDQIQFQEPGESVPISVVNPNTNEYILDNTESLFNTLTDRHGMNLRRGRTIDYRHL
ncbi:unnamed protein product [Schistosoma margrebowiei]|uniref:Uncharacterized protein n=1 Tax=Schistosoma margrebowiei TaxID=48269 RepID=A0A183N2H5_9TREM|nr:unnamed protein product [Schistosoma margrebowiei]